ncbi:MAG: hypothetical protein MHM6MM_001534 [Cercozoa sp. M6MM]
MLPRKDCFSYENVSSASQNGSKHYSNGEIDLVSALLDAGFHPDSGTLQQSVAGASVRVRGQWRDALCEAISHEVKTITHVLSHPCGHLSADVATRVASFTALCVPLGIHEHAIAQMVHAAMLETVAYCNGGSKDTLCVVSNSSPRVPSVAVACVVSGSSQLT